MGQLAPPVNTEPNPVVRARSAWWLVPVALGTAAALAGCGASDHRSQRVAVPSAHMPLTVNQAAAAGQTMPRTHVTSQTHVTPRTHVAQETHVTIQRSSAKHGSRVALSSAHNSIAVSQAAVTSQAGPGPQVTIQPSQAKRPGADVHTAAPRPGATIRIINGTSNATIGTLAEHTSVFLVWKASEAPIQIITSQGNLLLSSHARNGSIRLAAGTYGGLRVASPGAWTLRLRAAA
jgi:hypothetical protein